jgi:ABC-2 type transport system permease protein
VNFIQFMYPGIIAMTVFQTSIFSGLSVVWDREFGFLREVLVAPLNRSGIVLGKTIGAACIAIIQALVMLILAPVVKASLSVGLVVKLIPVVVVIAFAIAGLGLLIASRVRSQQGFQMLIQVIIFPLIFAAGIMFPLNNVPAWLAFISKIDPLTYGVDAVRQLFLGVPKAGSPFSVILFGHTMTILQDIGLVAAIAIVLLVPAALVFGQRE